MTLGTGALPDLSLLRRILAAGVLAPSADNHPRMRFEIAASGVRLIASASDAWAALPHLRFLDLLALGAVLENIDLRSTELGLTLRLAAWPDPLRPDRVADLRWNARERAPDPLSREIEARHTNRRFYKRMPLGAALQARIAAAAEGVPGARLAWLDTAPARGRALRAIRLAETERFRRPALHAELFEAMRFDLGWRGTADSGLPLASLQIERPMRGPFRGLRHWRVMRIAAACGAARLLGWRAGSLPAALSPHIGLLSMQGAADDDVRTLATGRAMQRLWLAATADGLAMQPMAAATVLLRQRSGAGWVDADAQARLHSLFGELLDTTLQQPMLMFRLGRAAAPEARAGRLPLDDYLV